MATTTKARPVSEMSRYQTEFAQQRIEVHTRGPWGTVALVRTLGAVDTSGTEQTVHLEIFDSTPDSVPGAFDRVEQTEHPRGVDFQLREIRSVRDIAHALLRLADEAERLGFAPADTDEVPDT